MKNRKFRRLLGSVLALIVILCGIAVVKSAPGRAESDATGRFKSIGAAKTGQTYYVDAKNGNDSANGTSPTTAWKTLTRVNQETFKPGDHILLNAQSTWNDTYLWPKGNGTKENPIAIDLYNLDSTGAVSYAADQRPVINGNGTKSIGTSERAVSGTVMLRNQEHWKIANLEVTNSEDLGNKDAYKKPGKTQRAGILVYGDRQDYTFSDFEITDNYVHDVQSEYYLNYSGARNTQRSKAVGGIIVYGAWFNENGEETIPANDHRSTTGFSDVLIQHNAVQRVGLEGIRTKADADTSRGNNFYKTFRNIQIKNNYLEDIAGDGVVLSEVADGGLVEGNVVARPCNADYGTQNYAGLWAMSTDNAVFQYNEVYGIRYGYNDAEAFDIDMACNHVTYQYNYSHDNAGGFMLTMGDQRNSIIRYNISANDGFGNKGTSADNPGKAGAYTYQQQSLMHYWQKSQDSTMPQVYNNTFYVGDGISTSLFGEGNSNANDGVTSRFTNNVLVKEGAGQFTFLSNYPANGGPAVERRLGGDLSKLFTNNDFYPASIATAKSGLTPDVIAAGNNVLADPKLAISQDNSLKQMLKDQSDTRFDPSKDDIKEFTGVDKLRARTEMFKPSQESPALGIGLTKDVQQDFFGTSLANKVIDAGFAQISTTTKTTVYKDQSLSLTSPTGVYPKLPKEMDFSYDEVVDGATVATGTQKATVRWDIIPMESVQKPGTVTVIGHPVGLKNDQVKATATVTFVGEIGEGKGNTTIVSDQVAYIQKSVGTTAYSAIAGNKGNISASDAYKYPFGVNYTGNWSAKLKNAGSAGYNRRTYVSVPTTKIGSVVKDATLDLTVMRYDAWNAASGSTNQEKLANTQYRVAVYATDPSWQSNSLTWNNAPGNANPGTPIAVQDVQNKDVIAAGNVLSIDLTAYLQSLIAQGNLPAQLSFMVMITDSNLPNYNADNAGFDLFTLEGAKQAYRDSQAGLVTLPAGTTLTETSLAPRLSVSDVYEKSIDPINVTTKAGVAPVLPQETTVHYSDGTSKTVAVVWPSIEASQYAQAGVFTVVGEAAGVNTPIVATITVSAPKKVTAFAELPTVDRYVGHARTDLDLPTSIVATLDDGSTVTFPILGWDDDPSNYSETSPAGTYHFPASLGDISGVEVPSGLKPTQTVRTHLRPAAIELPGQMTITQGGSKQVTPQVFDATHKLVDDWSSAVKYEIVAPAGNSTTVLPTVSPEGLVTVPDGTPVGTYTLLIKSVREPNVTASVTIEVTKKSSGNTGESGQPDKPDKPDQPGKPDVDKPTDNTTNGQSNNQGTGSNKSPVIKGDQSATTGHGQNGTLPQTGEERIQVLAWLGLLLSAGLLMALRAKRAEKE